MTLFLILFYIDFRVHLLSPSVLYCLVACEGRCLPLRDFPVPFRGETILTIFVEGVNSIPHSWHFEPNLAYTSLS